MQTDGENLQKSCSCSLCKQDADIQKFILELVSRFFASKKLHRAWKSRFLCGETIPQGWLRDHQRISRLFDTDINAAVEQVYKWTELQPSQRSSKDGNWDIILVNESLQLLIREGIPQKYAGGMLLMYLELCEGIFID